MRLKCVLGCLVLFLFFACSKENGPATDSVNTSKLTDFSVKVLERTSIIAVIQWDSSINTANNEPVKYRVILGNVVVHDSLSRLIDTLKNLEKNTIYTGKVVAFISTGDTRSAEFSLSTYDGFIYAFTGKTNDISRFGCFNSYPILAYNYDQPSMWRFNSGIPLAPTLSNDTLFTVTNNTMEAINATNGSRIWEIPDSLTFNTPATYNNGILYACRFHGELTAIDSRNGRVLWNYRSTTPGVSLNSTPVLENGKVFVAATNSSDGEIHAVDALSGQKIWSNENHSSKSDRPLARDGVVVFVSGMEGKAYAYDQATGNLIWTKSNLGSIGLDQFNPVYIDGKVLVQTSRYLFALDLHTGQEVWKFDNPHQIFDCVAGNGMIYFASDVGTSKPLVCVDAKTGKEMWRKPTATGQEYSHLVLAKDKIYCFVVYKYTTIPRTLVAFNSTNGNEDNLIRIVSPVTLADNEEILAFCMTRDGIVCYPSRHGNYK